MRGSVRSGLERLRRAPLVLFVLLYSVVTGGPLLPRDSIRRILVVKLDHIGDCIIAFPAVRRLKQHFPNARITVLTARASLPVWAYEPSVEQTIEFEFFHARSADGCKTSIA